MANIGTFIIPGIAQWAKVFEHNRDMEGFEGAYVDCDGAYTIDLVVDEDGLAIYERSKAAGKPKPAYLDEGTGTYTHKRKNNDDEANTRTDLFIIKFKRKHLDRVSDRFGGAPEIIGLPEGVTEIGNGSRVELRFSTYTTKMSNGCRMEKIRVVDLVEFEGRSDAEVDDDLPF